MVVRSNDTTGEELVYAMLLGKAERDEGNERYAAAMQVTQMC